MLLLLIIPQKRVLEISAGDEDGPAIKQLIGVIQVRFTAAL